MAYLHTPQICGTCRGVKVGIHGLLNWTAENLYLPLALPYNFLISLAGANQPRQNAVASLSVASIFDHIFTVFRRIIQCQKVQQVLKRRNRYSFAVVVDDDEEE
jgi:hypothetical protein